MSAHDHDLDTAGGNIAGHDVAPEGGVDFRTGEGLRSLLIRLGKTGDGAWRDDPQAAALMAYAAEKYAPLARRHGLDAWEAASAAFDAMRSGAVRQADDPWAVVTRAVQTTCIAEERANGLLCSVHQARRAQFSVFHDAERFGERENPLTDYHPAFHHHDETSVDDEDGLDTDQAAAPEHAGAGADESVTSAVSALADTIRLLSLLGWPAPVARAGVEYVCERLARAGSRAGAFESLRRDWHARALLDVSASSWHALLRVVLGNPEPEYAATAAGRGVLVRLLIGEPLGVLLRDDDLVLTVVAGAPRPAGGGDG